MRTILVISSKGGCGKSTISTNLATAFTQAGHNTLLCDCDRQKSALMWARRRSPALPRITSADWTKRLSLPKGDYDRVVIDAPAGIRSKKATELIRLSEDIIVPVLPSVFDENATIRFLAKLEELKPVRKRNRRVVMVANRLRTRTKTAALLEEFLSSLRNRTVARIRESQFYPQIAAEGRGLFDCGTRRARDLLGDWRSLLEFIEEG